MLSGLAPANWQFLQISPDEQVFKPIYCELSAWGESVAKEFLEDKAAKLVSTSRAFKSPKGTGHLRWGGHEMG